MTRGYRQFVVFSAGLAACEVGESLHLHEVMTQVEHKHNHADRAKVGRLTIVEKVSMSFSVDCQ